MRALNPIFIIITFFICIVLYSCRTAKLDPCDCKLPKNLEKIIDDYAAKFDSANFKDSSKIINLIHFRYNDSNYVLMSASCCREKEFINTYCFYKNILIIGTELNDTNELLKSACNEIPSYYRIFDDASIDYDPYFKERLYQIKDNNFVFMPIDSVIDDYLIDLLMKKGILPTPPPPPVE